MGNCESTEKNTIVAVFTAACEESVSGNWGEMGWGGPPAASLGTRGRDASFSVWLTGELSSSAIPRDVAAREML